MRISIYFIFFSALFLKFFNSHSQESKIKFGAYVDAYYVYDISKPFNNSRQYVTQYDRHNEFNISHAILSGTFEDEKIRANLGLHTGSYPINNYSAEPNTLYQAIYEANAGYKISENGWLDVGIFGGHFGYESALAIDRELYSPALATEYTPYYQTGVRYTHDISASTQFRVVVLNGWQNIAETNEHKSVGIAIDHSFTEKFSLSYGNYYGNESIASSTDNFRFHNNLLVKVEPSNNLALIGVVDYTTESNANSDALFLTAIGKYDFSEKWTLAGRYEYVSDKDEILIESITDQFEVQVISLSMNYSATENASLKVESKLYRGSEKIFSGTEGIGDTNFIINAGIMIRVE